MAKQALLAGTTSHIAYVFIQDSSVTTGAGLTGLAYNTGSLVASYVRPAAARAAITLATQTTTGAYSSGGFVEVDATNMPGVYRLDIPDAALATGVKSVVVHLKGAANMVPCVLEIDLVTYAPHDSNKFLGLLGQDVNDDSTDSVKFSHLLTLLRALADNSMSIASGVLRLKARDGTTNVGRTLTITGTVPSDTTRTAS